MLSEEIFLARRAIERLRDGLFDSLAIHRLTVENKEVQKAFHQGLEALEKNQPKPLCLCGSYGQGKSHALLHLNDQALAGGYATSVISLNFRETPFHQFPVIYQSLMENLTLPHQAHFIDAWKKLKNPDLLNDLEIPHRFRMVLMAMLRESKKLTPKEKALKKYRAYYPHEHEKWLENDFFGRTIPVSQLKQVLKYRHVEGYLEKSLVQRSNAPYVEMIQSLGNLFKKMGYRGWILFFDEGESISQVRITHRLKSYILLDQFFSQPSSIYPIFAFTEDFFDRLKQEPYEGDQPLFPKNYAEAWKEVPIIHLGPFSSQRWDTILDRLVALYSEAYQITFPPQTTKVLQTLLQKMQGKETRFQLRSLVNQLDIASQDSALETCVHL